MNIPNLALLNHDSISAHCRLHRRRLSSACGELRVGDLTPNPALPNNDLCPY